jgi:hypothetical protein
MSCIPDIQAVSLFVEGFGEKRTSPVLFKEELASIQSEAFGGAE